MNRDEIIRMAREAADKDAVDPFQYGYWTLTQEEVDRFFHAAYAAGAAAEREACAKVCEDEGSVDDLPMHYAAAIRARGQA